MVCLQYVSHDIQMYLSREVQDDELGRVEAGLGVARALAEVGVVVQLRTKHETAQARIQKRLSGAVNRHTAEGTGRGFFPLIRSSV